MSPTVVTLYACGECGFVEGERSQAGCCSNCGVPTKPHPYEFALPRALALFRTEDRKEPDRMTSTRIHADAFAHLQSLGASKAVFTFSGGNDEGGIDGVTLFASDGTKIPYGGEYGDFEWDESKQTPLDKDAESIVYAEYGSFAGDFSVNGSITYDVSAGTVSMSKSEQVWGEDEEYEV